MTEGVPFGPYSIIKRLATGGMAEVFLARSTGDPGGRLLVLKRMLPVLSADPEIATMFLDEARIASQLSHPFLIQVFDVGHVDRALFIAMEYVHGVNLAELHHAARARGLELPWPLAARLGCYLCEALQYAHDLRGIDGRPMNLVHRDITPTNILLTYAGAPRLVDFGIARAARRLSVTQPGVIKGKLLHAAPEQYLNKPLDSRADLYGLGLCLYELLSGRHPFAEASNPLEAARAVTEAKPPALAGQRRDVPKRLAELIHQALEKDAADRPQTALEMRTRLEGCLMDERAVTGMPELGQWLATIFPGRAALQPVRDDADADALTLPASAAAPRAGNPSTQPLDDAQRAVLLKSLEANPPVADGRTRTTPDTPSALPPPPPQEAPPPVLYPVPRWKRWGRAPWIASAVLVAVAAAWGLAAWVTGSRPLP